MGKQSTRLHQRGSECHGPQREPEVSGRACRGGWDSGADQPGQHCSVAQGGPWRGTGVPALCLGGTLGAMSHPESHGESVAEPGGWPSPARPGRHLSSMCLPRP